jgi:beta-lactamase class A
MYNQQVNKNSKLKKDIRKPAATSKPVTSFKNAEPNKQSSKRMQGIFKSVFFYVSMLLFTIIAYLLYAFNEPKNANGNSSFTKIVRQNDTSLSSPLLLVENSVYNDSLSQLKEKINKYIEQKKKEGILTAASVYVNELSTVNQMECNPGEYYDMASLAKLPTLLIYLKRAEDDPAILKQTLFYKEPFSKNVVATIKDHSITPGRAYTLDELLRYMIVYSDNEAYWLLCQRIANSEYKQLCDELSMPQILNNNKLVNDLGTFSANVNSVSRFFRVLYNATYVERKMSNYGLRLLTQCTFKDGILKGIAPNLTVAHKFGERIEGAETQLHEFGIVYLPKNPYLVGVMTKGTDKRKLEKVVGDISKIVYDEMKKDLVAK